MLIFISLALAFAGSVLSRRLDQNKVNSREAPDRHIVKLRNGITTLKRNKVKASLTSALSHEYSMGGFEAFAGTFTPEELARLGASDQVEYIEEDSVMHTTSYMSEYNAPWGISRLSSNTAGSTTYIYDDSAGAGTCAYIIDTGIQADHPEFEGRATALVDFVPEDPELDGHGTHVAGTIGSKTYGVAKKTKLYAIRVLDSTGGGKTTTVLDGVEYVINRTQDCPNGSVVNISLGGSRRQSLNDAAAALVQSGAFVAVSSGNEADDVQGVSPGSEPSVCTVGATMINDTRVEWSNYGSLVDVHAPGFDILSTWNNGSTAVESGTSMAAPHIAGLAAYYLGSGKLPVEGLCEYIKAAALKDILSEIPDGTPNLLASNGASG